MHGDGTTAITAHGIDLMERGMIDDLEPMAITPEMLNFSNFQYGSTEGIASFDEDRSEEGNTHYWDLLVKGSDVIDSFHFSLVKWGEQEYFTFSHHMLRVRIKFVHQLQNLFFAITGLELEIKFS